MAGSRDVVLANVRILTGQFARIIADEIDGGEFAPTDPQIAAHAVFDATARFHDPAHAAEWCDPDLDAAFEGVWSKVVAALTGRDSGDGVTGGTGHARR